MSFRPNSTRLVGHQTIPAQKQFAHGTIATISKPQPVSRTRPISPRIPLIITPPPPTSTPSNDGSNMPVLLKLFHVLSEKIAILISHNGSNYEFRTTISIIASDVEGLFGIFYKQASLQFGTYSVVQQGITPGFASRTSSYKKSGLNFL